MALIQREISYSHLQIDALDGLRGLAVLMVFASHSSNRGLFFFPQLNCEGIGKNGVFLFFVLSSFLLTRIFLATKRVDFPLFVNYGVRRFTRIYPLYIVYLIIALLITLTGFSSKTPFLLTPDQFIEHLFLYSSFGVTWSIAVEFKYYFLLPIFALIYRQLFYRPIYYAGIFTLLVVILFEYLFPESQSAQNDTRVWPYISLFVQGGFAAFLYERWSLLDGEVRIKYKGFISLIGLAAAAGLLVMIPGVFSFLTGQLIDRTQFHQMFFLQGLLWSTFLLATICGGGFYKIFNMKWLRYFGFISFSLYLFHVVVLDFLRPFYSFFGIIWVALFLAVVISHLTWIIIEKPSSRLSIFK